MFYEKHVINYRQGYILCNVSTKLSQRIQSKFIKKYKGKYKGNIPNFKSTQKVCNYF